MPKFEGFMKKREEFEERANPMTKGRYLFAGFFLCLAMIGGVFWMKKIHSRNNASAGKASVVNEGARSKGPADARVQIVEYSDFQCPACRNAEEEITKVMNEFAGKVHFVFRHFPLGGHRWSMPAHQAAECGNRAGKFWELHDRLYREQPVWSVSPNPTEFFFTYARNLGLNLDDFAACMTDASVTATLMRDKAEGERHEVKSTPTFFINGERVVGQVEFGVKGREIIQNLLKQAPAEGK